MEQIFGMNSTGFFYILIGVAMIGYSAYKIIQYFAMKKKDVGGVKLSKDYDALLSSLSVGARQIDVGGLAVELRNCGDRAEGQLDPRTAETGKMTRAYFRKNRAALPAQLRKNEVHLFGTENPGRFTPLENLRLQFGWVTEDKSSGIKATRLAIEGSRSQITAYKYETPSSGGNRPCMIFFHGGGFFGGVIATTENQCKLLAELSGAVVISVDYPLAPEHPFPEGFDACYETVKWVYENSDLLGVSKSKIAVSGTAQGATSRCVPPCATGMKSWA